MTIKVEKTHPLATFAKGTDKSSGYDLRACILDDYWLPPNETIKVSSGIKLNLPDDLDVLLLPRSGLGAKGLVLGNLIGLVDPDYTDTIQLVLWNRTNKPILIESGMRVAQLKFTPVLRLPIEFVDSVDQSGRGGFGSTGVN